MFLLFLVLNIWQSRCQTFHSDIQQLINQTHKTADDINITVELVWNYVESVDT